MVIVYSTMNFESGQFYNWLKKRSTQMLKQENLLLQNHIFKEKQVVA